MRTLKVCDLNRNVLCELIQNDGCGAIHINHHSSISEIDEIVFDFPINNPKSKYLDNENLILYFNEYYVIKNVVKCHDEENKLYLKVSCSHLSVKLSSDLISIEEVTPVNILSLMKVALQYDDQGVSRSGWQIGVVDIDKTIYRGLEANDESPFSILLQIADKFNAYPRFNSQNLTVDMLPLVKTDIPSIDFRINKNLKSFEVTYDTSSMITKMYCYGGADSEGNPIDIMNVNPTGLPYIENYQYFLAKGYTMDYITNHPEMFCMVSKFEDDSYYDEEDLYQASVKELDKASKPKIEVKMSALDLSKAKGVTVSDKDKIVNLEVGDCIRIVDSLLGLDFLCNVTSRDINHDEEHLLSMEITSNIEFKDLLKDLFNSVSKVNSITTSSGNIIGSKVEGLTTDNIFTNNLETENLTAKLAEINALIANSATVEWIKANYIDATSIGAKYATIANLEAVKATIQDLNVTELTAKVAIIENAQIDTAKIINLIGTNAEFENFTAENTIIKNLTAQKAEIDELQTTTIKTGILDAYKIEVENLYAKKQYVDDLDAENLKAKKAEITYAKIDELNTTNANITNLNTEITKTNELVAKKAEITDLNATNASVETLKTDVALIDKAMVNKLEASDLTVINADIASLKAKDVEINNALIDKASITDLNAVNATIGTLSSDYGEFKKLTAGQISTNSADIGELDAGLANINSIMAGNVGTGLVQTLHLTAKNVVIDDAVIKSAMIDDLDVSKLKAGTISTDKFTIQSDDGGIQISGSTQQFTDKNGRVRLQIGKDAQGKFNFIVFGEDGTTAIYNEHGITAKAVPDGLIVDQMVANNANIAGDKLDINSVVERINEDGTTTINSNKIWISEENQSLGAKFTSIEESIGGTSADLSNFITQTSKDLDSLQGQIDGSIQTYFYEYVPTNANVPANSWKTTDLKNNHLGDLFYNTVTGYCYRWQVVNNTYSWQRITDVDVTKALADASKAQDTADNKRRVFVATPTTPYDIGDLWSQGTSGDLMRCKVAKTSSQTYASADWEKASKYTDDTKANAVDKKVTTLQTDFTVEQGKISSLISETEILTETVSTVETIANQAKSTATSANTVATEAKSTASTASATASEAKTTADSASSLANSANTNANTAKTNASNALSTANTAKSTADTAKSTADTANTKATTAQTIADSKAKVFTSQPTTPYKIGDLWVQGTSGNIMKCKTARASGTYTASDWEKADKYTDDTKANAVQASLTTLTNRYNQTEQTVAGNTTTIGNVSTTVNDLTSEVESMDSRITQIKTTADGVNTTVTANKSKWDKASTDAINAQTIANQTAEKFTWIVKSGTSSTNFELTDRVADLTAEKINLNGLVTFGGLATDAQSKINTATSNASTALSTANTAKNTANSASSTATTAKNTADSANTKATNAQTSANNAADLAKAMANGKCMFSDVDFRIGTNTVGVYNNNSSTAPSAVTITRIAKTSDCPNKSDYCLEIKLVGNASPSYGGFVQSIPSRANAIFVQRFIAKLPIGYKFNTASNSMGTGYSDKFVTSSDGTGKYQEYIRIVRCGASGTFSGGGHVHISGSPAPTTSAPVYCYLASCTAYDITEPNILDSIISSSVIPGVSTINGGYITSNTITTNQLNTTEILAQNGTFLGIINSQEINANRITSGEIRANLISLYGLLVKNKISGKETFSIDNNGNVLLRGSVESYDFISNKSGWSINSSGSAEFNNVTVRGNLINPDAGITSNIASSKQVRFWAGASYEQRDFAPFRVYSDGSISATEGEFGGVFSGEIKIGNINIKDPSSNAGGDAILEIKNGQNGVKQIQLTDSGHSDFAQSVNITDNTYSKTIQLRQDGTIIANSSVSVQSGSLSTQIYQDRIYMNGTKISGSNNIMTLNASQINFGDASINDLNNININAKTTFNKQSTFLKDITFGSVFSLTIQTNGIDFEFIG